jgi:hypothetical protein
MRNHAPSKPHPGCRILLNGALNWEICVRVHERFHRLTDPDAYKNAIREYTKVLRSKKLSFWKDFCGRVDGIQPPARLHRILSKDDDYKMGIFRHPSGAS